MKNRGIVFLMVSFLCAASAVTEAADISSSSRISEVTVYSSGAFVTRTAAVEVKPGDARILIPDIIANFDSESLRVKGRGTAEVKILGAQVKTDFLEDTPVEKVRELEGRIRALEDQNRVLENEKRVLNDEKAYLDSVRLFAGQKIPEDLVTKMPSAQDLEATLSFLGSKLRENFNRGMTIDLEIRENGRKIDALRRELETISGNRQKVRYTAVVDIEVAKAGKLDVEVSYKVWDASWTPVYDARAKFDDSETEFIIYATVRQNTGESWDDVGMTLSTAQVTSGGSMPEAASWFIRPYQPPQPVMKAQALRSQTLASASKAALMMEDAVNDMKMPEAGQAPMGSENLYARAESKGISVVYKLTRQATVKPDGSDHKIPVSAQDLAARFEYSAYPRMIPAAYLKSRVVNSGDLQLPGGRVSIFFEGDFVGSSYVGNTAPGEEFDLYLGADDSVKVKRDLLEKKSDDVLIGNIPSSSKKIIYKYKLSAENYKARASKLSLFETIPVSQDERIKVKVAQVSQEPRDKDWKDRKGVWRWELQLEPKAKKEIFYTVIVEFPRDMRVEGLE